MKWYLFITFSTLLLLGAIALPLTATAKTVNNFRISNYDIDYQLSRDRDKRSTLKTTETITAEFPDSNQNHGIERAIPDTYDGHSVDLKIQSIVDGNGAAVEYSSRSENGNQILQIGDADRFVHGTKQYVITYTERDVTKYFKDNNRDEFYWDTNGVDWKVPIDELSVRLRVDESIAASTLEGASCYTGTRGSNESCTLMKNGIDYTVRQSALRPSENITIAVPFAAGTFSPYHQTTTEKLFGYWLNLQAALLIGVVILVTILCTLYYRRKNRTDEQTTLIAEYLPPRGVSLQVAAKLMKSPAGFSAQLLDLAVRGYLKIYQTKKRSLLSSDHYTLEIMRPIDDLLPEEKEIITDIFGEIVATGASFELKKLKSSYKYTVKFSDNDKKLSDLIQDVYTLRAKNTAQSKLFGRTSMALLVIGLVLLSPPLLLAAVISYGLAKTLRPLTDDGLKLVQYLKGLRLYIKTAETDRIKMLQSPSGAEKVRAGTDLDDTSDPKQQLILYEKLLPYAVLFGEEKDWNKQLGHYYETTGQQPGWLGGVAGVNGVFNAVLFTNALASFTDSSNFSAPGASSAGGSGGGGFSGGGGGGGGGGGW